MGFAQADAEGETARFTGWVVCAKAMREFDESLGKRWNDEVDTLLVFAGLFSAILTAFTLETYTMLQEDTQQSSLSVLQNIASQLNNISANTATGGPSYPVSVFPLPKFTPSTAAVRINTMWVSALVFSLISALLGILVKTWIREYGNRGVTSPRNGVRMRQFRYEGLVAWKLPDIVAALPLLLQLALVLFFIGLLDLLWTVNKTIAGLTTALVSSCLLGVGSSFVLPLLAPTAPFKSPLTLQIRHALSVVVWGPVRLLRLRCAPSSNHDPRSWWHHDWKAVLEEAGRATGNIDHTALEWAHENLLDDDLLDQIVPCVSDLASGTRAQFVFGLLAKTAHCAPWQLLDSLRNSPNEGVAVETLHRALLRSGHRANARMLRLVLDVIPDALPDSTRALVKTVQVQGRFSLVSGLPGIYPDESVLRESDMLAVLRPLISAFALTEYARSSFTSSLVQRAFNELLRLAGSPVHAARALALLQTLSPALRSYVQPDNVLKMLTITLRFSGGRDAGGLLPVPCAGARYDDHLQLLLPASTASLQYVCALTKEQRNAPDVRERLRELLVLMERHVRETTRNKLPYHPRDIRPFWCWELYQLSRRDVLLVDRSMVEALDQSHEGGLIHASEYKALGALRKILGVEITHGHPPIGIRPDVQRQHSAAERSASPAVPADTDQPGPRPAELVQPLPAVESKNISFRRAHGLKVVGQPIVKVESNGTQLSHDSPLGSPLEACAELRRYQKTPRAASPRRVATPSSCAAPIISPAQRALMRQGGGMSSGVGRRSLDSPRALLDSPPTPDQRPSSTPPSFAAEPRPSRGQAVVGSTPPRASPLLGRRSSILRPLKPRRRSTIDLPHKRPANAIVCDEEPPRSPELKRRHTLDLVVPDDLSAWPLALLPLPDLSRLLPAPPLPRRAQTPPIGRPAGPRDPLPGPSREAGFGSCAEKD